MWNATGLFIGHCPDLELSPGPKNPKTSTGKSGCACWRKFGALRHMKE